MKKYMFLLLLLAFLSGCAGTPQETPMLTETPATEVTLTPEPTPTPELLTAEQAANIYLEFLMDKMPCSYYEETLYHSELYSDMTPEWALKLYHAKDLTGDGIPELYCSGPGVTNIWTIQDGTVTCLGGKTTYEQILANGGIFYHRPGGVPDNDCYFYSWLSPESREYPEISFAAYDMDSDGEMDSFYIDSAEVTRSEWEARTAPYFALRDAEPTEEQKALPFLQWAAELGADIADFLDMEPWQAAYWDILMNPEEHEDVYTLSEEDISWLCENYGIGQNDVYSFSLCDLDGDNVPELLLGYGKRGEYSSFPRLLLNILRWNEETGTVEDLTGPRTYGLKDTLWFFENGYFGTMHGVSNLYTVFWKLEDTPGHYWDGFLRPWMAGEEPKREDIFFEDSQTGEIWSEDAFDALIGARTAEAVFQKLTSENIRQAFFPAEGEEVTP
ncbi:MAG: hypothetical protein J6J87_04180 [Oscillospiraceae bacterium]|nr:hypothetical protein [Oscillospiraceae bacterium]